MPGVPSIYYGSEFGIEGKRSWHSDYELRPCLDLNNIENADYSLFEHIVKLGKVRLSLDALKYGKFENVNIMNEKLVYKRQTQNQTVFVAFNLTNHDERIGFDAGCNAKLTDVLNDNEVFDVNGYCELPMKPYSSRILVVNDGSFKVDFDKDFSAENSEKNECQSEEKTAKAVKKLSCIKLGRYRHFKGNEYEVIAIAKHSETGELLVIYKSIDNEQNIWARPYDMFTEVVDFNGSKTLRFTPLF